MRLSYRVSKSVLTDEFIKNGKAGPSKRSIDVDPAELTEEQRKLLADEYENAFDRSEVELPPFPTKAFVGWVEQDYDWVDKVLTVNEWFDLLRLAREERDKKEAEAALLLQQEQEKIEQAKLKQERAKQAEQEAKLAREKEAREWIEAYGSEYLKKLLRSGFEYERVYLHERASIEYPDFDLDLDCMAEWRPVRCPSERALNELEAARREGAEADIVWLESPPDDCELFEPCEALLISDARYHGRKLIKVINK